MEWNCCKISSWAWRAGSWGPLLSRQRAEPSHLRNGTAAPRHGQQSCLTFRNHSGIWKISAFSTITSVLLLESICQLLCIKLETAAKMSAGSISVHTLTFVHWNETWKFACIFLSWFQTERSKKKVADNIGDTKAPNIWQTQSGELYTDKSKWRGNV